MVAVCLPSDALLQHLPSYLGVSYLGLGVSFHGCFSKAQPLLLILDKGYLLTTTLPELQHGIREMQIKTTTRYHFMPVRMAVIQKSTSNNAGEGVVNSVEIT